MPNVDDDKAAKNDDGSAGDGHKSVDIRRTDLISSYTIYAPPKLELLTS
jgi:hypothetical protein